MDPGSGTRDGKNSDSGSSIRDKLPGSAKLEISSQNLLGLEEPNNNQNLCGKGIWDENKSFLQSKAASVVLKERKNTCELDFSISNKTTPPLPNYVLRGETNTAAYLHKALAKIYCRLVFGLKRLSMSAQNLIFASMLPKKPSLPLFLITGCGKGANMFSQLHYSSYFAPAAFYLFLKVKSELASCLLTQGTFKKSL